MIKKVLSFIAIITIAISFQNCSSSKKAAKTPTPPDTPKVEMAEKKEVAKPNDVSATDVVAKKDATSVSYAADIAPMIKASCTPCHFPSEGGRKVALDSYAGVKDEIRDVLRSIKLPKDNHDFMPFQNKKTALTDAQIKTIEAWQLSGMAQ